jgi:UDP-2-acetamido-2-deoxy-ribo-hexuluronate aminotransferase
LVADYSGHVYHQYTIVLNDVDRDGLNAFLAENKIPSMIYYPVPGHRQKMFDHLTFRSMDLVTTDWLTERVISLPVHTEMDEEQMMYITQRVLKFINQ